jgi:hypothetical protein
VNMGDLAAAAALSRQVEYLFCEYVRRPIPPSSFNGL